MIISRILEGGAADRYGMHMYTNLGHMLYQLSHWSSGIGAVVLGYFSKYY